jgi:multidrug efflux pump subunit AcrA (membrane-fusion protein)
MEDYPTEGDLRMKRMFCLLIILIGLLLAGCSSTPTPAPQPVFTQAPEANSPSQNPENVVASGVVKPGQQTQLSFTQGGWVEAVQVSEGDKVETGELIVRLEGREQLEAAIQAAETEVLAAQQALDLLDENAGMEQAIAFQAVIDANQAVGAAKYSLYNYAVPSNLDDMEPMQALAKTGERLDQAREAFEPYKHKSSHDEVRRDLKENLDRAQSDYNAAMRWVRLEGALIMAQVELDDTRQELDKLADGPDPDRIAMAQSRLENTQSQLSVARTALDQLDLAAPIGGTVVAVNICSGEAVLPGQVVVVLGDLAHLQVETSDLSERDVSAVAIGQPVSVFIEALGMDVSGKVASIAPQADTIGGDVVYAVLVELDEQPAGLRWGMSVDVEIETE